MRLLALAVLPILLQVNVCENVPEGDIEYKACAVEDQKEGYECKELFVGGKSVRKVYREIPKASPSPETPNPLPSASASPITPASPIPSPIIEPSTPPVDIYCVLQPDGFYLTPPIDECPPCWRNDPDVIGYWGIAAGNPRNCTGANCGCGKVLNVHLTPHSTDDKFLRHRYDFEKKKFSGSETHKGCQPKTREEGVPEIWVYPPNDTPGLCDPFSSDVYWCHHKAQRHQCGKTKFEVRQAPFKSIILDTN